MLEALQCDIGRLVGAALVLTSASWLSAEELAVVTRVVDGDTLVVVIDGRQEKVRLIGVDTPETEHPQKPVEHFGKEASAFAKRMAGGKTVVLRPDPECANSVLQWSRLAEYSMQSTAGGPAMAKPKWKTTQNCCVPESPSTLGKAPPHRSFLSIRLCRLLGRVAWRDAEADRRTGASRGCRCSSRSLRYLKSWSRSGTSESHGFSQLVRSFGSSRTSASLSLAHCSPSCFCTGCANPSQLCCRCLTDFGPRRVRKRLAANTRTIPRPSENTLGCSR